jgi:predicted PurR-regulated permease PerM
MTSSRSEKYQTNALILSALSLFLIFPLRLLAALTAGLLVFNLVHVLTPFLRKKISSEVAKLIAVLLISSVVIGIITLAIFGLIAFFRNGAGSFPALLQKMADIIASAKNLLPPEIFEYLPGDPDEIKSKVVGSLHANASELQTFGKQFGRILAHILVGMVVGALLALREVSGHEKMGPLAASLAERAGILSDSFRDVVFAQVRISLINAFLTGVYLMIVLPLSGIHLPLVKTMVLLTFLTGLLPVIGNLISNTVIVIVSLSNSLVVAVGSLVFLVVIHKLEYFLNAKIIGSRINARPWELLIAMLVMESAFGLPGLIAAPIYYAYGKSELVRLKLI